MACKPKSLTQHLKSHGDLFKYDDLIGAVINTGANAEDKV